MPQSEILEMAAEVVAAFVSNNPLPKGELPALIQTIHDFLARLSGGVENAAPNEEPKHPAVDPQIDHAGIFDLPGGRQKVQVAETALGYPWPDAGSISREMEASSRLSCGRARLRRDAVGIGQSDRSWTIGRKGRRAQAWTPAESRSSLIRVRVKRSYLPLRLFVALPRPSGGRRRPMRNDPSNDIRRGGICRKTAKLIEPRRSRRFELRATSRNLLHERCQRRLTLPRVVAQARPQRRRAHIRDVAKRLVPHLERSGFVVMKKPPIGGGAALGRGFGG